MVLLHTFSKQLYILHVRSEDFIHEESGLWLGYEADREPEDTCCIRL
jgi:hypothetical protein